MNSFLKQGLREKWVIRFVDVSGGAKQNGRTTKDNFREIRYVCVAIMPSPPTQHHICPSSSCICYHLGKTQCSILHASSFNLRKCQTPGEEIWIIRQDDTHTWNSSSICNKQNLKQKMRSKSCILTIYIWKCLSLGIASWINSIWMLSCSIDYIRT